MRILLRRAILAVFLAPGLAAAQTTFTVTTTNQTTDGVCDATCSLQEAILAANAAAGRDTIAFNIPGPGTRTLALTAALPSVTDPLLIDGTTQPGQDTQPIIRLEGSALTAAYGLEIETDSTQVMGLIIEGFDQDGIWLLGSSHSEIGTISPELSNWIRNNGKAGVRLSGGSSDNLLQWNNFYDNTENGVVLAPSAGTNNRISNNLIWGNGALNIDLNADGVTANDSLDADTGPNNLQNWPVMDKVVFGFDRAEGTLNSMPSTQYRLQFFSDTICDQFDHGEAAVNNGERLVTTDANGNADFEHILIGNIELGDFASVIAIDPSGNTSEVSNCKPATTMTVRVEPDSGKTDRGGSEDYTVFVTPAGGDWEQQVVMSCSNLPGVTSCEFSPDTFVLTGAEVQTNLMVHTTLIPGGSATGPASPIGPPEALLIGFLTVALALFGAALRRDDRRGRRLGFRLGFASAVLGLLLYTGCSSDSTPTEPDAGTPLGKHTFVVVAGSPSLDATATAILVVDP
jgi:CSLREA domain-containing protein